MVSFIYFYSEKQKRRESNYLTAMPKGMNLPFYGPDKAEKADRKLWDSEITSMVSKPKRENLE